MDFEASNKRNFCVGDDDDGNLNVNNSCEKKTSHSDVMREPVSCQDFESEHDVDEVPVSPKFSPISSLGTCSSKRDLSVQTRDIGITTMPVKRLFDNSNSLHISVKKLKMSPYYDQNEDKDDIPSSNRTGRLGKSADKSFSSLKKEVKLVEKLFKKCKRKRKVEEKRLQSIKRDIEDCWKELGKKKQQVICVRRLNEIHNNMLGKLERKEEELKALAQKVAECNMELESKEKELDAMKILVSGQAEILESERKKLLKVMSIRQNDPRAQMEDFESMKKCFEGQVKELESKEKQVEGRAMELNSKEMQLEVRENEFKSKLEKFEGQEKELVSKQKHFEIRLKELESKEKHLQGRVKASESREKQLEGHVKQFESKKVELEYCIKEMESKKKLFKNWVNELESKKKEVEGRAMELESKEMQLEGRKKEFESKEEKFEGQMKEREFKIQHFESQLKELESKENQLVGRVKEFKFKEKELVSKQKHIVSRMKKLDSNEKQHEARVKEHELKEKELEGRVKELELQNKHFESQVEDFKSKDKQIEERWKKLESKENQFKVKVQELELKEKQVAGRVKELESRLDKFDGQLKEPELTGKQYEALKKYINEEKESVASYMDDRLSPTIDGTSLQLDMSDKTDGVESLRNDIYVYLLESSDPSRLVLDIIQNPIIPLCKKGDNGVVIEDSHIYVLEELMRISPTIRPCVREEALKLAHDLRAYIRENTENSLAVLGFLLLLSIYGLLTSFDEDEVLELFASVAQHKTAMELFETLGFANKVSDFVENLIKRKQFVVAVRFSCAYNLADKTKQVDLLQQHIQNAKLICANSCKKTNSIEIKDKARDQEIASLETVQQCISDCRLQSEVLENEIGYRMLELQAHKGK
ncbi:spindle pole body component 110 isoform X2 [Medicago truncatula]|uniref:spindle pole body component 110 isoform X2 n=1 Tax=Medicago truncatula TaxID=3880 RepID=UPI001967DE4A|nr:spindle pole body component 110 isoform X2 [Medicago truncatula]